MISISARQGGLSDLTCGNEVHNMVCRDDGGVVLSLCSSG